MSSYRAVRYNRCTSVWENNYNKKIIMLNIINLEIIKYKFLNLIKILTSLVEWSIKLKSIVSKYKYTDSNNNNNNN